MYLISNIMKTDQLMNIVLNISKRYHRETDAFEKSKLICEMESLIDKHNEEIIAKDEEKHRSGISFMDWWSGLTVIEQTEHCTKHGFGYPGMGEIKHMYLYKNRIIE